MMSVNRDNGDAELKVETVRLTYVKPQKPLGRKDVQLVTFDLQCLSIKYIQWLYVFRSDDKFNEVEEKLKNGLRSVLEDYFPLAGRMVKDDEGILRVAYDDDMDGVELKTAFGVEVYVDDLMVGNRVDKFKEFFPHNDVSNIEGFSRSLLGVQLTKLKDGFSLGCAFNHAVVDGISIWQFMKALAEKCGGSTTDVLLKPFHDRTKARNTCVKMNLSLTSRVVPPLSQRVFPFSGAAVSNIKSSTNERRKDGKPFSSFQCVAAHVWRAITRARQLTSEDVTTVVVYVNSRRRIDPPVPEGYFGNLITSAPTTTMKAGVLLTSPPETTTSLIQKAIKTHDSNTIDRALKEWERNPKPFQLARYGNNPVCFGSSPRFEFYRLDFGWGKIEKVWCGVNNRGDGLVYMNPGNNGDGSIDVDISLEDNAMKRLEMDKEFLIHN